jgi:hypothetical protein
VPALQIDVEFAGTGHAMQLAPHDPVLVSARQLPPPQSWYPALHV